MNLTQFCESRGVRVNAVSNYIARHPEIREHTRREGKELLLSAEAIELLDPVYPVPKPVRIVEGVPKEDYIALQEKYAAAMETVTRLQEQQMVLQKKISQGEAAQLLLEDREKQLEDKEKRLKSVEKRLSDAISERDQAREAAAEAEKRAQTEHSEVERLKSRSLWERILNQ